MYNALVLIKKLNYCQVLQTKRFWENEIKDIHKALMIAFSKSHITDCGQLSIKLNMKTNSSK